MTLIIKVAESKFEDIRALLARTDGVEAVTEPGAGGAEDWDDEDEVIIEPLTREERIAGLRESIQQVKDHQAGKIELRPISELLDELDEIAAHVRR